MLKLLTIHRYDVSSPSLHFSPLVGSYDKDISSSYHDICLLFQFNILVPFLDITENN